MSRLRRLVLSLRIARRFARSRRTRSSSLTALLAAAVVTLMYVVLQAQTLTGEQVADRDLGRYDAYAGFGPATFGPGSSVRRTLNRVVTPVAGDQSQVALIAVDFSVSALSEGSTTLVEMDWTAQPFPDKYELLSGRWPQNPGEVAVVNPDGDEYQRLPRTLSAYGDRVTLEAVGTVNDRFSQSVALLAAPGTWGDIPPELARLNQLLLAQPVVYWDGARPQDVVTAVTKGYRVLLGNGAPDGLRDQVWETYASRGTLMAEGEKSWLAESPAGYTIPSLLLPVLAALMVFAVNRRRLAPALVTMTSIGVPKRVAVGGVWLALTGWCLVATLAGSLAGLLLGAGGARALAELLGLPIPAMPDVTSPLVRLPLLTIVGCLIGLVSLISPLREQPGNSGERGEPRSRSGRLRDARQLLALATFGGAAVQLSRLDSAPDTMLLAATVATGILLVVPDVVPRLLQHLPERHLRARLSKRQLLADVRRASTLVSVFAVLLGLSTGFVALLDTMIRTAGAQVYPDVLPGQVKIADRATDVVPPLKMAVNTARTVPALRDQTPVQMRFLGVFGEPGEPVPRVVAGNFDGLIFAVDTRRDAERLLNQQLTDAQATLLRTGGMLLWEPTFTSKEIDLWIKRQGQNSKHIATVPAGPLPITPAYWNIGGTGLTLTGTANHYDLPVASGAVMYTGLTSEDAAAVRSALERAGIDRYIAQIYQTPPTPIPPLALYLTAVGLVLVTFVVTLSLTGTQVRTLRDHLGLLIALGLSTRWVRLVLAHQHLVLLGFATVLGLAIGLPAVVCAAVFIPGFQLSIPWGQLSVLVGSLYASVLLATVLASRRLAAQDRTR